MGGATSNQAPIQVALLTNPLYGPENAKVESTIRVGHICNPKDQNMHLCGPTLDCLLNKAVSTFGDASEKAHPFYNHKSPRDPTVCELEFRCNTTKLKYTRAASPPMRSAPVVRGKGFYSSQDEFVHLYSREIYQKTPTNEEIALFRVFIDLDHSSDLFMARFPKLASSSLRANALKNLALAG
jgi:hypothetical protein